MAFSESAKNTGIHVLIYDNKHAEPWERALGHEHF